MHLMYYSILLEVLLNLRYRGFMYSFGLNVKHMIDRRETNEEVTAKFKSQQLTGDTQSCPTLTLISSVCFETVGKRQWRSCPHGPATYSMLIQKSVCATTFRMPERSMYWIFLKLLDKWT